MVPPSSLTPDFLAGGASKADSVRHIIIVSLDLNAGWSPIEDDGELLLRDMAVE